MDRPTGNPVDQAAGRFLLGVFGFVFGGAGVALLVFLLTASGWDAPPPFFRVVGSLMAIAFIAFGGTMVFASFRGRAMQVNSSSADRAAGAAASVGYTCPSCGATLGKDADVSPLGDVKCTFCGRWFNVHKHG